MKRLSSAELSAKLAGKRIEFCGWVQEARDFGSLRFLSLRDSKGSLQVTANKKSTPPEIFRLLQGISKESVVRVSGKLQKSSKAPRGLELLPEKIEILSAAEMPTPLDLSGKIDSGLTARLDWRCLDLRLPKNQAIFKITSKILEGMQEWLNKKSYLQVFTPCIMGVTSEGGAEVFKLKYFEREAFLRQDPQLHRQLTIAGGIEKLYDIGPSWRAELSHTTKHLCEHRTCAVEQAFIEDELETERVQENLIISALSKVKKDCREELKLFNAKLNVPEKPFPELRFPEIYEILEGMGKKLEPLGDIDSEADKLLWEYVQKKFRGKEFYFFNRFPSKHKPFYVMRVDSEPDYARSVDLNYKGVELSSGGQREHRYEKIVQQAKEKGMNEKNIEWFSKFFRYGVPPHGGFAMGIERLVMQLLEIENIREVVLFPRTPERVEP